MNRAWPALKQRCYGVGTARHLSDQELCSHSRQVNSCYTFKDCLFNSLMGCSPIMT